LTSFIVLVFGENYAIRDLKGPAPGVNSKNDTKRIGQLPKSQLAKNINLSLSVIFMFRVTFWRLTISVSISKNYLFRRILVKMMPKLNFKALLLGTYSQQFFLYETYELDQ